MRRVSSRYHLVFSGVLILAASGFSAEATAAGDPDSNARRRGSGLRGEYFAKTMGLEGDPVLVRVDPTVDFDWGEAAPAEEVGANIYSVRWTGYLVAPTTGEYTLHLTSDDGSRLWLDDDLVIDNWGDHAMEELAGKIHLAAGVPRRIKIEFYENMVYAGAKLEWSAPGIEREVIPTEALFGPDADFEPPVVATVAAGGGRRHGVGTTVKIVVSEGNREEGGEEGLTGRVRITSASTAYETVLTNLRCLPDGVYVAEWDTTGLAPAEDYAVEVTLTDAADNSDTDGLPQAPDLTIALSPGGKIRSLDGPASGSPAPGCIAEPGGSCAAGACMLLPLLALLGWRGRSRPRFVRAAP